MTTTLPNFVTALGSKMTSFKKISDILGVFFKKNFYCWQKAILGSGFFPGKRMKYISTKGIFVLVLIFGIQSVSWSQTTFSWRNDQNPTSGQWNVSNYWWNGSAAALPSGAEILFLDGSVGTTMTNDLPSTNRFKITFGSTNTPAARIIGGSTSNTFYEYGSTWPRIQNDATGITHTLGFPIAASTNSGFNLELVANAGPLVFTNTINNNGRTLQIYGNNTAVDVTNRFVKFNGIISGAGIFNISQFAVAKLNAANTYTGQTQIDNGELWLESSGSITGGGGIYVGNGGQLTNVAKLWLSNTSGGTTFSPNITINAGNYQTRYLGGLNSSGTNTFSGTITNNAGYISLAAISSGGTTTFSNAISGTGQVNIEGAGIVNFTGSNNYSGLTYITGTLQLGATNVIPDAPGVTLGGGTLKTGATTGFSETIGSLTVSANSAITLGSGVHTLTIANSSANTWVGTTLTINNWIGTFGSSGTAAAGKIQVGSGGFNSGQLAKVQFTGFPVGAVITASGELVPSSAPTSISPTENGGFESGTTFAANGWTTVNSATTNGSKWLVGTTSLTNGSYTFPLSGSRVGYVSNTGSSWSYNTTSITTSTSHIYTDVTFPSGQTSFLSFRYNVNGETSQYDVLYVYLCPQTLTPAVGSPSSTSSTPTWTGTGTATLTLLGAYNLLAAGQGNFVTIPISTAQALNASANSNMRLVFTWKNDSSTGAEPPAAIDNIYLASSAAMTGTYTIDNTLPTSGTNFANFSAAIQALNARGISGAVTFNVTAGQTFTEDPPALSATGTVSNTIVFQKSGSGANPVIKPTGGAGTADFGIAIIGGDYITFDGIDITENTGSAVEYGYYTGSASTTNGAQNNTIKNTTITLNRANTTSYGIIQNAAYVPTATTNANNTNKYYNLNIKNAYYGIALLGDATAPDQSCEIGTTACATRNIIGDGATANDIGNGTTATWGIKALNQAICKIYNNDVSNVTSTGSGIPADGIWLEFGTPGNTTLSLGTSEIYNNKINGISCTSTGTFTGAVARGIRVNQNANAGSIARVYNNFISNLQSATTNATLTTRKVIGINLQPAGSGAGSTINCDFNSVSINAATLGNSNACLEIGTTSGPVMKVRNNILSNTTAAQSGSAKHYCWITSSATSIGATGSISNYNDLYVANTNGFVGLANTTDKTALSDWQGVATNDANSKSVLPEFTSATDLHAASATLNGAADPSYATNSSWVTLDIDCATRPSPTDIGADEYTPVTPTISLSTNNIIAGAIVQGTTNNPIYSFAIGVTTSNAVLTGLTATTTGNYLSADVTNLKVWYQTTSTFNAGTATLLSTSTTPGVAGLKTFPSFVNQTIASGVTGYIFITADLPCTATATNTISINAITASNTTFSSGTPTGTPSAGNTQTITTATPVNATSPAASILSESSSVSWTAPTGCFDEILIVARAGSANDGIPTGNGTAYTGNLAFGSGTALGSGFVVYKGTTSPQVVTGLTNGTTYYYKIFTRNGSVWSSGVEVNATPAVTYCTPDNLNCSLSDFISNITFNTLNNTTTCGTATTGYTTYAATGAQTTTVTIGSSYNITLSSGSGSGTHGAAVWIDFNNNGVFTDSGEYFLISNSIAASSTTTPVSITIPTGAFIGNVRMRVRYIYATTITSAMSCNSGGTYGETEDYTISIVAGCTQPTTQATIGAYTNNSTGTSLTVNWTRGNGTGGVIVVARATATSNVLPTGGTTYTPSTVGAFGGTTTTGTGNIVVYNGTGTTVDVTGLTAGTSYTFSVYEFNSTSNCYNTSASSSAVTTCTSGTPSVAITVTTGANPTCTGSSVTFTATPTNGGTPTYQWKLNGTNVGTSSTTYTNAALANGDLVSCVMTNSAACTTTATSNTITISVTAAPTTSNAGTAQSSCGGTTPVTLAANTPSVGTGAWTVTSGPSTLVSQFSSTTNPTAVFTPAGGTGAYVLTWTITSGGCSSASTVTITVNPNPNTPTVTPASTSICPAVIQTLTATGTTLSSTYINETFSTGTAWPTGWSSSVPLGTDTVAVTASISAGGTANEITFSSNNGISTTGLDRAIYGPFNTTGQTSLSLSWKNYLSHYSSSYSYYVKVQTSTDGVTWHDSSWGTNPVTASIAVGPQTTTLTTDVGSSTLYLSFTMGGLTFGANYWYIDNVLLTSPTVTANPVWTPITNLYSNAAATTPYVAATQATTVYFKSSTPGTYNYTTTSTLGSCPLTGSTSVTVKTPVGITSVTAAASPICSTATTSLTANGVVGAGAVVTWYTGSGATGTNLGTGLTLSNVGPGTYYARVTGDCGSPAEASVTVAAKVNVGITSVTAAVNPICASATTTLTANGVVGTNAVVTWYTGAGGTGTNLGTGTTLTAGPGTYYARVTGDCGSPVEASVTVGSKVNVGITGISAAANPICASATTTLTANGVVGTNAVVTWYTGAGGTGTNLGTGVTTTKGPGTYYARVTGDCGTAEANFTINAIAEPTWANLQWPPTGAICQTGSYTAYGQVYQSGVTDSAGQGSGITVQFGYNGTDTDPSTWTSWSAASYNVDYGNNDEYLYTFTPPSSGTFYYTFRYRQGSCNWIYGGYSAGGGGAWSGSNVSGILTVTASPSAGTLGGSQAVCISDSTTFTSTSSDGSWSSSDTGVASINATTGVVTPVAAGTATMTYTVTGTGGCSNATNTRTVTVNQVTNGGTASSNQIICSGETPSAITLASSVGSVVKWQSSSDAAFTSPTDITNTSTTLTLGSLSATTYYRAVVQSGACSSANSNVVTITVNSLPTVSIASNNSPVCSGAASFSLTGTTDAVVTYNINGGTNATTTLTGGAATISVPNPFASQVLTLVSVANNGCTSSLSDTSTVSVFATTYNGTSWSNGDPDSSKLAIFTGNYTIAADLTACSLRVTNNAVVTVNSNYNVYLNGAITVDSGSSFTMNNNSNLFQADASAVNTGNIVVKRNTSTIVRLDHTLWSSPVTGQNLFSFSPNTLVNRFYVYNTATNSYVTTGLSNTSLFTPAKGFAVRAPNNQSATTPAVWTGTFTGVPNNGTKTFTLATNAANGYNYNLVGNPYPSAISASDFYAANASKIGGTLYFYAHTLTMNASGIFPTGTNYATWTGLGGAAATAGDGHTPAVAPNGIIQVGQGFIVKASAAGDVTFTNAMRVANQQNQFMKAATTTAETHRMWLNLKTDTGVDVNQILVGYMDGATQGVDAGLDGLSFGNTGSYLYSKIENDNFVIQARSLPFDVTDEVPLGFNCATAGSYSISLTNTDGLFAADQDILVRDNLTGTDTSIKTVPYTFNSETGVFDTRFRLVYTQALGVPSTNFTENSVIVYKNTDWFHVNTKGIEMKDIMVYDISGRLIYSKKDINATTAVLNGLTTTNQVLILKINSIEDKTVTIKVIN